MVIPIMVCSLVQINLLKMILKFIDILALKTSILQLNIKSLPV